jgi:hypothetical protein
MQKIIATFLILTFGILAASGQCGKKVTWTGSKALVLDSGGTVLDSLNDHIVAETGPDSVKFMHGGREDDALHGHVQVLSCHWDPNYSRGVTELKGELTEGDGGTHHAEIRIEGKDGKLTILLKLVDEDRTRWFKILVDGYQERS